MMSALTGACAACSEPKLGKKEEQKLAAERVGGKFTPPEPPTLVVNNE
jgi:hypothetical protein